MTHDEVRRWGRWMTRGGKLTDPVSVRGDPVPALVDVAQWLRHPRSFLRKAGA
jgi:hypothetical protein